MKQEIEQDGMGQLYCQVVLIGRVRHNKNVFAGESSRRANVYPNLLVTS